MFGNEPFPLSSLIPAEIQHPEVAKKPLEEVADELLQHGVITKGVDLVMRDQAAKGRLLEPRKALALIVVYWMQSEGIDPFGENPLMDPEEYGHASQPAITKAKKVWQWLISEG